MRRSMSWLLTGVLSVVIVGFARPAAAQDTPKVEVAGGWNYLAARSNADESWEHFYKGGFGEVAVNLNSKWGAVGNVAYDQKTITDVGGDVKVKVIPYLFGVRFSSRTSSKNTPFLQFLAGPNAPLPFLVHWTQVNAKHVAQAVKELGAGSVLISSDLGQSGNMVHPDGLEAAVAAMKKEGISDADIDTMMRKNPAKLLGLAG